ncbi:MAG: NAD(P)-binding protein [Cyanobacteria bacterium J06632_22]
MPQDTRQKIAVLGGGIGSLSTVYELTSQPGWEALYDITVYQLGWRLGGKGASGRNVKPEQPGQEPNYRIEEHGLHIFFGFYENAFRIMKDCYEELGEDGPFSSVEDAFKPHDFIVLEDYFNGQWHPWRFNFPRNSLKPWEASSPTQLWQHLISALILIYRVWENSEVLGTTSPACPMGQGSMPQGSMPQGSMPNVLEAPFKQIYRNLEAIGLTTGAVVGSLSEHWDQTLFENPAKNPTSHPQPRGIAEENRQKSEPWPHLANEGIYLHLAKELAQALPENHRHLSQAHPSVLLKLIERFMEELEDLWRNRINEHPDLRRELIIINYGLANIRALLAEGGLFKPSLDFLDQYDYNEWLQRYGAWDETLQSPMVRSIYDLVYAYPKGDIRQPQLAAGVALRIVINIFFRYKGAVMWKMQAGMGDTIFAPLYKVLKRRGVKFEFFNRVTALHLSDDQSRIERIDINSQVDLIQDYDPLIRVKGLLCWPSEPNYEFIQPEQATALQANNINLESFWTAWREQETPYTLQVRSEANPEGEFDTVLFGISLGAVPYLCDEFLTADKTPAARETSEKWRNLVEQVQTVTTQGDQFWLTPTLSQLGWTMPSAVVGTYVEPLDTYADMTHLLPQENWTAENTPHNLAYFTGVAADPGMPPASDHDFPARAQAQFETQVALFLDNHIGALWPEATPPDNPDGLDRSLLVSQYLRLNIFPTERYVMSLPGSTQYRLKADESGFDNLYLTGDWIRNGFNAGAIEPTVISGLQTARAILQKEHGRTPTQEIRGESTLWT